MFSHFLVMWLPAVAGVSDLVTPIPPHSWLEITAPILDVVFQVVCTIEICRYGTDIFCPVLILHLYEYSVNNLPDHYLAPPLPHSQAFQGCSTMGPNALQCGSLPWHPYLPTSSGSSDSGFHCPCLLIALLLLVLFLRLIRLCLLCLQCRQAHCWHSVWRQPCFAPTSWWARWPHLVSKR